MRFRAPGNRTPLFYMFKYFKDLPKHAWIIAELDNQVIEKEMPNIIKRLKKKDLEAQSFFLFVILIYLKELGLNKFEKEDDYKNELANLIHERFHRTWKISNKEAFNIWVECCKTNTSENAKNKIYKSGFDKAVSYTENIKKIIYPERIFE